MLYVVCSHWHHLVFPYIKPFVLIIHRLTCNTTFCKTYHLYKFKSSIKFLKYTTCFGQHGHHQVLKICLMRKSLLSLVTDAYVVPLMRVCVVVVVFFVACLVPECSAGLDWFLFCNVFWSLSVVDYYREVLKNS
jgi:hypothetical protein